MANDYIWQDENGNEFKVGGSPSAQFQKDYVDKRIAELHNPKASDIVFDDGESLQHKLSSGTLKGAPGNDGKDGADGAPGEKGEKGATGDRGAQGPVGAKGEKGDKGDTGPAGPQGEKGDTGEQGPRGEQGLPGEPGTVESIPEHSIKEKQLEITKIIQNEEGEFYPETNRIYKTVIATDFEFVFPSVSEISDKDVTNQILVYVDVMAETAVSWLTADGAEVVFVNGTVPDMTIGYHRVIAEFNPLSEKWVIGVIQDGDA